MSLSTEQMSSDLLQHLRLLLQTAVQVTAGIHTEVFHHHLIDQFLQFTQLGAQMSEGHIQKTCDINILILTCYSSS